MKFSESKSSECRWSEFAERLIGDWDVLWEHAEVDYQGFAELLAAKDGRFCYLQWSYGSCSGCDQWEDMPEEQAFDDFKTGAMFFESADSVREWLKMLRSTKDPKGYTLGAFVS